MNKPMLYTYLEVFVAYLEFCIISIISFEEMIELVGYNLPISIMI